MEAPLIECREDGRDVQKDEKGHILMQWNNLVSKLYVRSATLQHRKGLLGAPFFMAGVKASLPPCNFLDRTFLLALPRYVCGGLTSYA